MFGSVMRRWVWVVTISYRCPVSLGRTSLTSGPKAKGVSVPARIKALLAWALWLATLGCCAGGHRGVVAAGAASGARLAGPWVWLQRCWRGWSTSPPPRQLQQALDWVRAGQPLYLYLPP